MKTKTSNKLNILLIAITLLLVFVACVSAFGSTGSWLTNSDEVGFKVMVEDINLKVKQNGVEIENQGYIYLGTNVIESDTDYSLGVTITNAETKGTGLYIRFQAIALINGVENNINDYITTSNFYKEGDGWFYSNISGSSTRTTLAPGAERTMMEKANFPSSFLSQHQGKYFKLFLYIEGSPDGAFG